MHKLLLLMALSILSVKAHAATCPDGSEPVKSVSDDGEISGVWGVGDRIKIELVKK
jgi:hypothetical protein